MTVSRHTRTPIRIPEPDQIRLWVQHTLRAARRYFSVPERQMVAVLLLFAALLRLVYLDLVPLGMAQISHLTQARDIRYGTYFPLTGLPSSDGVVNGPWMSYLLAIPMLFGRDPRLISGILVLVNVAAVGGIYYIGRRYYTPRVGLAAALLLASNPWAILFSRNIVYASFLLPLGVLLLATLLHAIVDRQGWAWTAAWATMGMMLAISFQALPALFVLVILTIIYYRRIQWPYYIVGLMVVAVILLPYLYAENERRFADVAALIARIVQRPPNNAARLNVVRWIIWEQAGLGLGSLASDEATPLFASPLLTLNRIALAVFLISLPVLLVRALAAWAQWRRQQSDSGYSIAGIWLLVALLSSRLFSHPIQPDALALVLPVGMLSMGIAIDAFLRIPARWRERQHDIGQILRLGVLLLSAAFIVWQAYTVIYFYTYTSTHDTSQTYGTPYRYWRRTANLIEREAKGESLQNVWFLGTSLDNGMNMRLPLQYLLDPSLSTVFIRQTQQPAMLLPVGQGAVYVLGHSEPLITATLRQIGASKRGVSIFADGETEAGVYVSQAIPIDELLARIGERGLWPLDSGAYLVGYDWPPTAAPGEDAALATYWTFLNVPVDETQSGHQAFTHLIAPDGTKVAVCEGFGLDERYWQQGLLFKQWCVLPIPAQAPPGEYALQTGMYRTSDGHYNHLINAQGQDLGNAIPLGPVSVGKPVP